MNLSHFVNDSFYIALKDFFSQLNIPVNYLTDKPSAPGDIIPRNFKPGNESHKLLEDVYFLGLVDDSAFKGPGRIKMEDVNDKTGQVDYEGILIFGVTLTPRPGGLHPTRAQLAELTRAFNREFNYTPVVVIFKYGNYLTFSNCERVKYKQSWREGEKAGKVAMLKDIALINTHTGHNKILDQLRIVKEGKNAVRNFIQLYFFWQSIFSISVLNKAFYEDIIEWFNTAINDIRIPGQPAGSEKNKDFTIRLIARMIFIWFLKELKVVNDELLLVKFPNGVNNALIKPRQKGNSYYKFTKYMTKIYKYL
jgi:hypothetical protein